jgi:hypothetical protein
LRRYKLMEPKSLLIDGHICSFIIRLRSDNEPLNVHPAQSLRREAFVLLLLSLVVFEEKNPDKEVEEEETAD